MPYEKTRKERLGAKVLSINPPATTTPLKMATGRAPKVTTQTLQMGPEWEDMGRCEGNTSPYINTQSALPRRSPTPPDSEPTHAVMALPSPKVSSHSG